jgi:hypothetical protein
LLKTEGEAAAAANPIRKVVTLMQKMQKDIEQEGKKEKKLFEQFMCYCDDNLGKLHASVKAGEDDVPKLASQVEASENKKAELEEDLKDAHATRSADEAAIKDAEAKRSKEHKDYIDLKEHYTTDLEVMETVEKKLEHDGGASFLQTSSAKTLRLLVEQKQDLDEDVRAHMLSFLSSGRSSSPDMIVGVLTEMEHEENQTLTAATEDELAAVKAELELVKAKNKEIKALGAAIESKTKRAGELGVEIVQKKADLEDSSESLAEDKHILADLDKNCKAKTAEWEERQKTRMEELAALSDTIEFLNSDDALELFKKTLPSKDASLLQTVAQSSGLARRARDVLLRDAAKLSRPSRASLDLIALALRGKKVGFEGVLKKIDEMVVVLEHEQKADDAKKDRCDAKLDAAEDEKKELDHKMSDLKAEVAENEDSVDTRLKHMDALKEGLLNADDAATKATEQRKKEHSEFKELVASDTAAMELLSMAKKRLDKFYHPKTNKGDEEGTSFVQIASHAQLRQATPPPPPPTVEGGYKKSDSNHGVIGMISALISELDKEIAEAKVEEKNGQEEYEQTLADLKEKRKEDSKALVKSADSEAEEKAALLISKKDLSDTSKQLALSGKHEHNLHNECDWLLKNHQVRKEARAAERDSMTRAKAVLSGADFSLLQMTSRSALRR